VLTVLRKHALSTFRSLHPRRSSTGRSKTIQGNGLKFEPLERRMMLSGFTAYNDTIGGTLTHDNATLYADGGGSDGAGQLKDITTGDYTGVHLSAFWGDGSIHFGGTGGRPSDGTDAGDIFGNFVEFRSTNGSSSVELPDSQTYTYEFTDLDPGNTYQFAGTAVRGNSGYTRRWTLVTLIGADSFTSAHSTGDGIVTDGLLPNQVALWSGANHLSNQGFVVQWTDIATADGEFEVVSQRYTGPIPTTVDSSGMAGDKGYGLAGIRLIEDVPSGPPEVVNTAATNIEAFAAELAGEITATGGQAPNTTVYYGESDGGTVADDWDQLIDLGPQTRAFSWLAGGLDQATTYYYRAFAENTIGSAWAPTTESFTTLTAYTPSLVNLPASNVGAFSAALAGEVTDTGNDSPLVTVYYGQTDGGTNPGSWDHSIEVGPQSGAFAAVIDDLEPETSYFFSAYARNAVGGAWASPSLSLETIAVPPLQITEFMADNGETLYTRTRDSEGDPFIGDATSPDWIEIHNPTDAVAVLDGFHLSDDLDDPTAWEFPTGTSIEPGGFLLVFASGEDVTEAALDENGSLHTDFKLRDDGEDVALTDADGAVVFAYEDYPVQSKDDSYGIGGDGQERYFPIPTPTGDNANDVPRAPQFSVASTTFTGSLELELIPGYPSDTIHYTLNEAVPSASSPVYGGPLTIADTTMVRAVSIGTNGKSSQIFSESYIELGADVLDDSSNLPMMIVETFGDGVYGKSSGFGDTFIAVFEPGADGRTRLTDPMTAGTRGGMHIRGSSSGGFAKKQYRVELWDESNVDRKIELLGMPDEADWIFYGPNRYDRVLISNPLMYDLSNQIGRYATRTKWVEMYINAGGGQVTSGDYVGAYAIMEVIESGDDRVDIEPLSSGAGGVPVHGGFAWKKDKSGRYVEPEDANSAQRSYINGYINDTEAAAVSSNFADPDDGYAAYLDVDSFVDHNILNMLAMNVDALRISAYYYKTEEGKLEAGPIWDFDRALDSTDGRDNNPSWWYGTGDSTRFFNDDTYNATRSMRWWSRVFDDPNFVQKYIDRWFELRENEFSLTNIYATIDAHAADLQEAGPRDYSRWSGSRYGNFAGEIQHLKDWLTTRINWIDSQWLARPTFSVSGPVVPQSMPVQLSSPVGDVYYTLDGSDPRAPGGGISGTAIRATGSVTIGAYTKITARVRRVGHTPSSGHPGYVATGDDWSAPASAEYFVNPLAAPGDLIITEINYHPFDATAAELATQLPVDPDFEDNDFEFIELLNDSGQAVNLCGAGFVDGVKLEFGSQVLESGEQVVVVEDLEGFTARYGIDGSLDGTGITVAGVFKGELSNDGERLTLVGRDGSTLLDFTYNDAAGWPGRADGKGASLELVEPADVPLDPAERTLHLEMPDSWRSSDEYGGSPGEEGSEPVVNVLINEVLTHTDDPLKDTIELHNTTGGVIDVGGWYLSDSWGWGGNNGADDYKKFRIPDFTTIPGGGYLVFDEHNFNPTPFDSLPNHFALDGAHGDDVWLMQADADGNLTRFVDHVKFGAAANGESFGRWTNGFGDLYPMNERTLGWANSGPRVGPVIISEVHYNPSDEPDANDFEFVEIYNSTGAAEDLTDWRIRKGIDYDFPDDTILGCGAALVIVSFDTDDADKLTAFRAYHDIDDSVSILGGYSGQLDNGGEKVQLQRPDEPPADEQNFIPRLLEDEVRYYDDEPGWPTEPDGGGASLHRLGQDAWGNDSASWVAAVPTPGVTIFSPSATVAGRHVFYNDSAYDNPDLGGSDQLAIAHDKQALLPGQTATLANYTSYHLGLNGIMVDVAGLPADAALDAGDFRFHAGNDGEPANWAGAPSPTTITVQRGQGDQDSDRIVLVWDDNPVTNRWLQLTVRATADTGLAEDDVFYFGNAVGESGNSAADARVNAFDVLAARNNPRNLLNSAPIDFHYDFNRDQRVNAADMLLARNNQTHFLDGLKLITVPGLKSAKGGWDVSSPAEEGFVPPADVQRLLELAFAGSQDRPSKRDKSAGEAIDQFFLGY